MLSLFWNCSSFLNFFLSQNTQITLHLGNFLAVASKYLSSVNTWCQWSFQQTWRVWHEVRPQSTPPGMGSFRNIFKEFLQIGIPRKHSRQTLACMKEEGLGRGEAGLQCRLNKTQPHGGSAAGMDLQSSHSWGGGASPLCPTQSSSLRWGGGVPRRGSVLGQGSSLRPSKPRRANVGHPPSSWRDKS